MKVIAVSGYFNPLHLGHLRYINDAKKLGDVLIVIVNNDRQVKLKGAISLMNLSERVEIISNLKAVDMVVEAVDDDKSVCKTLEIIRPHIFCKGGDRTIDNIPEVKICKQLKIQMMFGIGGEKIQSSSALLKGVKDA